MKKIIFSRAILFSLLSLSIPISILSQTNQSTGFVMPEIKIYQKEGTKNVIYHFESDYNLFAISNDTLIADPFKYNYRTTLNSVSAIGIRNGTYVGKGMLYSSLVGFIAGYTFGLWKQASFGFSSGTDIVSPFFYGFVFAIPFTLIGELIGFATPYYDKINLPKSNLNKKRQSIINEFSKFGYQYEIEGGK